MLDLILSKFNPKDKVTLDFNHYTQSNAKSDISQTDRRSKTRLNSRIQAEVNLNIDLNRNIVFRLSSGLKLKYWKKRS